jgi:hypothetical protein
MENFHTVIVKDLHARGDLKVTGTQLARALDIPFIDAMPLVKRHYGYILADRLESSQAEKFLAGLDSVGFAAMSIPSGEMATLVGLGVAKRLEYHDNHLRALIGSPARATDIPWEEIRLLMMGQLQIETTTIKVEIVRSTSMAFDGDVADYSEPMITSEKQVDHKLMAYAIASDGRCLGLPGKGLLYTHLGDRIKPGSRENYRTVLSDIRSHCPKAFATEAYASFLEGGPVPSVPNYKAFDEEAVWLLQLNRLGLLPE